MTTCPPRPDPPPEGDPGHLADDAEHTGDAPPAEVDTAMLDLAPDPHERPGGARAQVVPLPRRSPASRAPARLDRLDRPDRRPPGTPDPERLVVLLVRLCSEVAAGRRPVAQLEPLLAPTLLRRLVAQLRPGIVRPSGTPSIRRVLIAPTSPTGAVEATVLLEEDGRVTALAVRLERHRGLWRATELTAPESGYRPLPTRSDPLTRREPDAFDEAASETEDGEAAVTRRRGTA